MGISFTVVFLCENVQLALTVSPRITNVYLDMKFDFLGGTFHSDQHKNVAETNAVFVRHYQHF